MATKLGAGFDRLTVASGISNIGDGVHGAAFPLFVATLTRDPFLVAMATIVGRLPWFLFALVSGALVDRMDRKRVMIVTDGVRAVVVTLLAVGIWLGEVDLIVIYIVAFGLGVAETFFDTSAEAFTPQLVSDDQLPEANGRLQGLEWVGGAFAGPPLGAFLFAVAASLPFFIDGISFAVAAVFIAVIPGTFRSERTITTGIGQDIKEGLKWLWGQRIVRTLVLMAGTTNLVGTAIIAIFVLYAQDVLGVDDVAYGILMAVIGAGGLVGALLAPRVVRTIGQGNTLRLVVGSSAVLSAVFITVTNVWVAGAILFLYGFFITGWNVVAVSLRQAITPDELRARVAGAARLLAWGTQPLGALIGGVLASSFGLRSPFVVGAVGWGLLLAVTWRIVSNENLDAARSGA